MEQRIKVIWGKTGDMRPGRQIQEHCHACYQLYCILEGTATFFVDGQELPVTEGDCFLIPPMVYHSMLPLESGSVRSLDLKFLVQDGALHRKLAKVPPVLHGCGPIRKQLMYVEQNWTGRDPGTQSAISDLLTALLLTLVMDELHSEDAPGSRHILTEGYSALTCRILDHIERNYPYPFSLEEMGHTLNYNKNYLCSAFRKNTGICIVDYLNFIRIRYAVACFAFYGQDVGTTCTITGYTNLSHFSRTFKALTGLSPRAFRRAFTLCSAEEIPVIFSEEPILSYRICTLEEALASLQHIGRTAADLLEAHQ